jgi:outer membrane cobalamin receptor
MLSFIALALLLSGPAAPDSAAPAADSLAVSSRDSLPLYRVSGITVIATRMPLPQLLAPASVSVVEPEPISPTSGPAGLLAETPSVSLGAYGGPGSLNSISLRSASSTDVLYMVDGRPLNSARDGTFDLNRLPSGITKIEVMRGPAAALYGANAAAGAVNFITSQPRRPRPYSRLRYQQGSFDQKTLEAMLARNLYRWLGFELGGSWDKTGGQRMNSDYDRLRYSLRLKASPTDDIEGSADYRYFKSENGNPGSLSWPTPAERQKDFQEDLGLSLKYRFLGFSASQNISERNVVADYGPTDNWSRRRQAEINAFRTLLTRIHLTAGVSHQEDWDKSSASGNNSLDQTSAFASQQTDLPWSFLAAASLRYDHTKAYPSQLSPNLSLGWNGLTDFFLHLSYGRSYRAPSLVDLYWPVEVYPPYYGLAFKMSGNPDLKPETSRQLELGVKYQPGRLKASLSFFQRRTKDLIDWTHTVFLPPDTSYTYPENIGRVKAAGAEASLSLGIWDWMDLELSFAQCRTVEDTTSGRILPYRPLNTASAVARINDIKLAHHLWIGWRLSLRYSDRQTVRHQSEWAQGIELPRFLVADQTFSVKLRDARLFYSMENLGNALYQTRYGYPMPRRSHLFGVVLELWD